jgi:hypothetical protein
MAIKYKTMEVEVEYDDGCECDATERETDFRRDLYRAIYAGNVEEAENIMNLMAMVGIDRELIWEARK